MAASDRLVAIDWLRGGVMVLMAVDHASGAFNAGRVAVDSSYAVDAFFVPAWEPGGALPTAQFFTRWITHLCAPTFLFLSGTSLALSAAQRGERGHTPGSIDRHLALRGVILIGLEAVWLSLGPSVMVGRYLLVLQVLYAIGTGLVCMALLRRLPSGVLVALALAWWCGGEWLTGWWAPASGSPPGPAAALLVAPGSFGFAAVAYPALPWLAMMMLGWAFGAHLLTLRERRVAAASVAGRCALAGAICLALFAAVRFANGYGNMGLLRDGPGVVQWLHVSKYPPSLSFAALELGLMALSLAAAFVLQARLSRAPWRNDPVLVLGQTALFFYLLHFPLLGIAAAAVGRIGTGGLIDSYAAALGVTAALYPACRWYRSYKAAHPDGWTQYI